MRDWARETQSRVDFIKQVIKEAGASEIVFGNSGGKDCALVGILCRMACENVIGVIMPCGSKRNYGSDKDDAIALASKFGIKTLVVDLTPARDALLKGIEESSWLTPDETMPDETKPDETKPGNIGSVKISPLALSNINPRLRMTALYTLAQSRGALVAGTGNRSETYMGYFTKWGDGAYDFNPISDLTVREVYAYLRYLGAPDSIIAKAPSAGLFEGQTDESDMGVTYEAIDSFLLDGVCSQEDLAIIERYHSRSAHKRKLARLYDPGVWEA